MTTRGLGVGGLGSMPLGGDDDRGLATTTLVTSGGLGPSNVRQRNNKTWRRGLGGGELGSVALGGANEGLIGAGDMSPSVITQLDETVSVTGTGTITPSDIREWVTASVMSGSGTITTNTVWWSATGTALAGAGTLGPSDIREWHASTEAGLGAGDLGSMPLGGGDAVYGEGTVTASVITQLDEAAALVGAGALAMAGRRERLFSPGLSGVGTITPDPVWWRSTGSALTATSTADGHEVREWHTSTTVGLGNTALGTGELGGAEPMEAAGEISAYPITQLDEAAALVATSVLSPNEIYENLESTSLAGTGVLSMLAGFPDWRIDGTSVRKLDEEIRDWQELKLTWRAPLDVTKNTLRPLDKNSGSVEVLVQSDGSFVAFDMSGGSNTFTLEPPIYRDPLRTTDDYVVDDYKESVVGPEGQTFEVTVKFIDEESRETTSTLNESRDTGEWQFQFDSGTLSTSRVKSDISSKTKNGEGSKSIVLVLTQEQVKVVEESATYLESVTVHEVPDGENFAVDESPGDRNTVTVTAPSNGEDVLASGTYAVTDWKSEWTSDDFFTVELELVET